MKRVIIAAISLLVISSEMTFASPETSGASVRPDASAVPELSSLTLHEKICQMFVLRPEGLDGKSLTYLTDEIKTMLRDYPVGGFALFACNIIDSVQCAALVDSLHSLLHYPLVSVDEEGGRVARIANNKAMGVRNVGVAYKTGTSGDSGAAFDSGAEVGSYLHRFGFDIDFAPVADVWSNPLNKVIAERSFSKEPAVAAEMSSEFLKGLRSAGVVGCLKHFPGHGDVESDSHYGLPVSAKTWDEMLECEIVPFRKGIESGARMIMTAHICATSIVGEKLPSTLSKTILTDKLRGELGFNGIIVTDGFEMAAIRKFDAEGENVIRAIEAGVDMILLPVDVRSAVKAVEDAVESGRLSESAIDASVARILELKRDILSGNL